MTVGTYGGGIAMSSPIQTPSLYGVACRTPRVVLGARSGGKDKDFVVQYVTKGGPAEEAGLTEGDKILTVNGRFVADDPFVWEKEIYSKQPGDRITVEYLRDGKKASTVVRLTSPRQQPTAPNLASPYYGK
jgi:S1-C subfamily serine protease